MARGYAARRKDGVFLINTVSETERAAAVNWLVTVAGVGVTNYWTDEEIFGAFERFAEPNYNIVEIEVKDAYDV